MRLISLSVMQSVARPFSPAVHSRRPKLTTCQSTQGEAYSCESAPAPCIIPITVSRLLVIDKFKDRIFSSDGDLESGLVVLLPGSEIATPTATRRSALLATAAATSALLPGSLMTPGAALAAGKVLPFLISILSKNQPPVLVEAPHKPWVNRGCMFACWLAWQ